ncbi:MAG: hypothetical protein KC656_12060 [Myxococcales bacterium]|nr:hypothetical protein [Myxococcales bacterium]
MTAQIDDQVLLDDDEESWSLSAVDGGPLFDPSSVGLSPVMISTACWRGWYAHYRVRDERLTVDRLDVGLDGEDAERAVAGTGPLVGGRPPTKRSYSGKVWKDGVWVEGTFEEIEWTWAGLALPVPFTGGMLVSRGFLRELYVHMGFHPAWKYEHTVELVLREGQVVERRDVSASMAALRAELAGRDAPGTAERRRIEAWVEGAFSRRYPGLH